MKFGNSTSSHFWAALLVVPWLLVVAHGGTPASRPNFLLIITDQQQAAMMSCTGNRWLKTPHMDRLASRGMRFEKAYAANPVCIPSRFSMFTGLMPSAINMEHNTDRGKTVGSDIFTHAMGTILRSAGYHTVYGGKLHLPGGPGVLENSAAYGFENRLAPLDHEGRDETVEACVQFIKTGHEQPFLLVASLINPHDICYLPMRDSLQAAPASAARQPPISPSALAEVDKAMQIPAGISVEEYYARLCPPLPQNYAVATRELSATGHTGGYLGFAHKSYTDRQWLMYRWVYARLTERVDAQVGRILDALRDSGLEENTVVIFVSDHGDQNGAHHYATKGLLYEESTRVPFLVSWKGVIPPNQVDAEHLVSTGLDLIPTMCDFAGICRPAALNGRSVRPLLEGKKVNEWRKQLVVENSNARLVRFENWKYLAGSPPTPAATKRNATAEWVREALYDLNTDAGEMNNLAFEPAHRSRVQEGRRLLKQWYDAHNLPLSAKYIVTD